jgi:predicted deacylase
MERSEIIIGGDTAGIEWRIPVFRFKGRDAKAPSTYIQAALHANELPGTALLHFLLERLRKADADGAILGDITVIPQANPIGLAQSHFGEMQGRFDLGSRANFNRDFPLIALSERDTLLDNPDRRSAADRLKRTLLHAALGAELVIDLHCDDESLQYAYIDEAFWPEAADLAAALDMQAVFLSDGESTAFEEAVGYAFKRQGGEKLASVPGRLSVTVELRGRRRRRCRPGPRGKALCRLRHTARQYRDGPRARARHRAVPPRYRRDGEGGRPAGDAHHPARHAGRHARHQGRP